MNNNSFSDSEKLLIYAQQIHESGIDITPDQKKEWTEIAYACASQGENGREPFHLISSLYPNYSHEECDCHFSYCLKTSKNCVGIGTLVKIAMDHGVKLKLPSGRRPMSTKEKEEQQKNRMSQMTEILNQQAEWRFNVWRQRPEVKEQDGDWRSVQDRDLDTFYCRLHQNGVKGTIQDLKSLIYSRDFSHDYDAINTWLDNLQPWNPETDPDYLRDFYNGHLGFNDPENEDFYYMMFKKWHVGMVAMMRGLSNENPIMPIFKGLQHIGKSYFARHILPPHLKSYLIEVAPYTRIDKDFTISLSETPLILVDELSFGGDQKSDAFKQIVTLTSSNLRDSYSRFREQRERRASLIATTNEEQFIPNSEGNRRYLVVDLKETVNLENFPLPYEGAYAQAVYLLEHGFQHKPDHDESQIITQHNSSYVKLNDCEEVLKTLLRKPEAGEQGIALSSGDILIKLGEMGHHGRSFSTSEIGKALTRMGFEKKRIHGCSKYRVEWISEGNHDKENVEDAKEFIPECADLL